MITRFTKVAKNIIKLDNNGSINTSFWLNFLIPLLGQAWSDETFVFMHKHAGLKLGFGIQGSDVCPAVLVYSENNECVRIFMKMNGLVTEVFAEDGDILFDNPQEAIQYVKDIEVLNAVAEIADVVLSALLVTVKVKNESESTPANDAAASAKVIVEDLIKKFGFDSDAIYRRNGKHYITHSGSILCVKNDSVMTEAYVGRIDQMPDGFMQALRTAENLVKTYNL